MTKENYKHGRVLLWTGMICLSFLSFLVIFDSFKTIKNLEKKEGILIEKTVLKECFKGNNYRYTFKFKLDGYSGTS